MNEMKSNQPAYSHEAIRTTMDSPRASEAPSAPATQPDLPPDGATRSPSLLSFAQNFRQVSLQEIADFLKRSRHTLLLGAEVALGLIAAINTVGCVSEWAADARERRHERAVATVTPDRLIARCGQAKEDVTKEVFPIVMRTMSYQTGGSRKLVVDFSRTAEAQSDWVFLSMNDANGAYETADAKVAALPCLDSTK